MKETKNKIEQALSLYNYDISDEEVREAVRKIIAEKVPENDTLEVKKFLLVFLYKAFHWKEYERENKQYIIIILLTIIILFFQMLRAR